MGQISSYFWDVEELVEDKCRNYGWKKDLPDRRDYHLSLIHTVLPEKVD